MLLIGIFLLSTGLAAEGNFLDLVVKVCIEEGKAKSLGAQVNNETLAANCSAVTINQPYYTLDLRQQNISDFATDWYYLQDYPIHTIDLSENQIVEITSEVLNHLPKNITNVDLTRNKIKCLKSGIIQNEHMISLRLALNNINKIENGALAKMNLSGALSLFGNKLTDTEFAATLPLDLKKLDLGANSIWKISAGSFTKLRKLLSLSLTVNQIKVISQAAFEGLTSLEFLNLSLNDILQVEDYSFFTLHALRTLHLYDNKITVITKRTFQGLINLELLTLSSNPIKKVKSNVFKSSHLLNMIQYNGVEYFGSTDLAEILQQCEGVEIEIKKRKFITREEYISQFSRGPG